MFARFIYFIAIGWWLGLFATILANLLMITIIGIPLGILILNRLPTLVFMREDGEPCPEGFDHRHEREPLPFILRAVWFLILGWELSILAVIFGYLFILTVIGVPVGIYILNRVPLIVTLSRHYD